MNNTLLMRATPPPVDPTATPPHPKPTVYAALLAVQLFFGINYYATKIILAEIQPRAWACLRVTGATVLLLAIHTLFIRRYPTRKDCLWLALFSLFGIVINQILFVEGLARTTPSHSALIGTTIPVLTMLMAVGMGAERLQGLKIFGIALALGGVCRLLGIGNVNFNQAQRFGDFLTLLNCVSFALFLVVSRKVVSRYDAVTSTTFLMLFGTIGINLACFADLRTFFAGPVGQVSTKGWAHAVYIVVFPTVVNYWLNYWALKRVDASVVAAFIYVQPVLATALSVSLLGESVTTGMVVSSALIFGGVFLTSPAARRFFNERRRPEETNPEPSGVREEPSLPPC